MTTTRESGSGPTPGSEAVAVPIGTFRHYMDFVVTHDLWDELTEALEEKGTRSVLLAGAQVALVQELVATRGPEINDRPEHGGSLVVPECSLICPQPKTPVDVSWSGFDGGSDGGHDGG